MSYAELGDLDPAEYHAIAAAAERRQWTHTDELLALLLEQLGHHHRTLAAFAGVKPHDLPKPVHYPRPGELERKPPAATRDERYARIRVKPAGG